MKKQFRTEVTAASLATTEADLIIRLHEHLARRKPGISQHMLRVLLIALKLLCIAGLVLGAALLYWQYVVTLTLVCMAFFILVLWRFWHQPRVEQRQARTRHAILHWCAKKRAAAMLRAAKQQAPFSAEYELIENLAVYRRNKGGQSNTVWSRRLTGFSQSGDGYTMLFKKPKSIYPYAFLLHDDSGEVQAYLEGLGVVRM